MSIDHIVSAIVDAVHQAGGRCTFGIDASEWSEEDIRNLIIRAKDESSAKGANLKGARVGGDILFKLGGLGAGYENARFENKLPVVATSEFGMIELVFRP